jgi:hypothetical protein
MDAEGIRYNVPFGWQKPGKQTVVCKVNSSYFSDADDKVFKTTESNYANNEYVVNIDVKEAK